MAFTDRFVKLPCMLVNKQHEDMGIDNLEEVPTFIRINPFEISRYHPTSPNGEGELTETKVFFKDGEHVILEMTCDDFEKMLNEKTK